MAFACHITYGDTKKIVKFSNYLHDDIIAEIREAFGIKLLGFPNSLRLQKYEEKWKDWVDVTPLELQQGMKIKVVPSSAPFSPTEEVHSPGSASTILLEGSSSTTSCDEDLDSLPMPIFEIPLTECSDSYSFSLAAGDSISPKTSSPQPPEPSATATIISTQSKVKDEDQSFRNVWPKKFELPPLPRRLVEKLDKGIFPDERERRLIISCVFNEMASFVMYPTSEQYNEVAALLVKKFPVLAEEHFCSTPYYYWKTRIMDKFRNERKNFPTKRKLQNPTEPTATSSQSTKMQKQSLVGEDAASTSRHQKWLQEEAKKKKQDLQKISLLMEKTFLSRREDIIHHPEKISFWKERYPLLFDSSELCKEYSRITDRDTPLALEDAVKPFMKVLDDILSLNEDDTIYAYNQKMRTFTEEDDINSLRCATVLLYLPTCFKENINSVFVLDNQNISDKPLPSEPVIIGTGNNRLDATELTVMAENEVVCQVPTIIQGFKCLIATFYAFNISFPKKCQKTLFFLDLLLGSKAKKIPRSVVTFLTKYKKN